jgi:hypothetical protein
MAITADQASNGLLDLSDPSQLATALNEHIEQLVSSMRNSECLIKHSCLLLEMLLSSKLEFRDRMKQ